ncbi:TPA: hypothetical protein KRM61_001036 [Clostridioides difficile]|nr:hypothetical protein [Clostridioides difficile]MDO0129807.1 hypothetical protein [Clostridioides difficile]VHU61377.1 Uncharacterised protein [Clostridioides difficile]HBG2115421.1 hypothetical protein [Clostridioides difficile]HBG2166073.1 hypothetical protein [Clostridioides difficile]
MIYKDKRLLSRLLKIISNKEKKIQMLKKELEAYKELAAEGELNFYFAKEDGEYHIELYNLNENFGEFSRDVILTRRALQKELEKEKNFKGKIFKRTKESTIYDNIDYIIKNNMFVNMKDCFLEGIDTSILEKVCGADKEYEVITTIKGESFIIFKDKY